VPAATIGIETKFVAVTVTIVPGGPESTLRITIHEPGCEPANDSTTHPSDAYTGVKGRVRATNETKNNATMSNANQM
jgi:hypothetical protein